MARYQPLPYSSPESLLCYLPHFPITGSTRPCPRNGSGDTLGGVVGEEVVWGGWRAGNRGQPGGVIRLKIYREKL